MRRGQRRGPGRRDTDRWLHGALHAVGDGVVVVDAEGTVRLANAAALRLLGWDGGDLDGASWPQVVHHSRPDGTPMSERESTVLACVRHGAIHRRTADVLWRRDGTALEVELSTSPIRDDGDIVGAAVTFTPASDRSADHLAEVQRLTERDRAQREVVHQLQEAVQPPMPHVGGVELAVHYLPADPTQPTGGDLYDWRVLPDGDVHLAVVDVMGKGVAATKDALTIVHALRVLVLEGCPMERLVATIDRLLRDTNPALVATLLVGRYTPATGRLRLAGGGHPPLLVVSPDGGVREIPAPGIPVGWPEACSFEVVEVELGRSETAVLYTDGLVEARRDILAGLADLRAAAAETATYPVRHLPRVLIERALAGASRRDDSLALVLRRRTAPTGPAPRLLGGFSHRFSPSMAAVPVARHLFDEWLGHQSVDDADHDDLLLVVSELCTNAVRMASGQPGGVVLRAWAEATDLVVEVEDDGDGFAVPPPSPDELPPVDAGSGRGLFIVQSVVDDVSVDRTASGTVVRSVKRCLFPEPLTDDALARSGDRGR